jgi:FAD binding domain
MPTKQYAEATDTADGFPRIREIGSDIRLLWHRKDSIMNTEPLIVGAGPTGLAAALFLADRGIHSRVIDKALGLSTTSRAQVINPRTLELLEPTGVIEAILSEARQIHQFVFYEDWNRLAELEFGNALVRIIERHEHGGPRDFQIRPPCNARPQRLRSIAAG